MRADNRRIPCSSAGHVVPWSSHFVGCRFWWNMAGQPGSCHRNLRRLAEGLRTVLNDKGSASGSWQGVVAAQPVPGRGPEKCWRRIDSMLTERIPVTRLCRSILFPARKLRIRASPAGEGISQCGRLRDRSAS